MIHREYPSEQYEPTFAEIVEDVKQLSAAEKEELQEFLRTYLIEERRREIRENAEAGLKEYRDCKLKSFLDCTELIRCLAS